MLGAADAGAAAKRLAAAIPPAAIALFTAVLLNRMLIPNRLVGTGCWSFWPVPVSCWVCCQVMPGVSRRLTSYERTARLAADPVWGWWDARCPSPPRG